MIIFKGLKGSTIKKDFLYTIAGKIVAMISYFGLDIVIARFMGYKIYDEWNFFFSILVIGNWIVRFGIDASTKAYIASNESNRHIQDSYLITGLKLQLFVSTMYLLTWLFIVDFCARQLGYPFKYKHLKLLLVVGAIYSSGYGVYALIKECFVGYIEFKKVFLLSVCEFLGYFLWGTLGIWVYGIYGLMIGYLISIIITIMYGLVLVRNKKGKQQILCKEKYIKEIFKYALYLSIANIGGLVLTEMDTFMLGIFGNQEVGIYSVAKNLISKATNIPQAICVSTMTVMAFVNSENIENKLKKYKKIILAGMLSAVIISICFIIIGKVFIDISYGKEYLESYNILMILLVYFCLYSLTGFLSTFLIYQKSGKGIALSYIVLILSNLLLNYLWIPEKGAIGAALASSLSMVPYTLILIYLNKCSLVKIKNMEIKNEQNY